MAASAQGLDVSNFQGQVNWGTLSNGLSFAFAKATESTNFTDAYFAHNWQGMASAGLHRGAYHFFHPGTDPVAQARFFVGTVKAQGLRPGDILAADVEITAGMELEGALRGSRLIVHAGGAVTLPARTLHRQDLDVYAPAEMTAGSVASAAKAFCDEVRALAGPSCPVMIYTNLTVGNTLSGCGGYPLWMAYPAAGPPPVPSPWRNWLMWQWGYSNSIDADAFNGTASMLTTWIASYQPQPPASGATPTEDQMQLTVTRPDGGTDYYSLLASGTIVHAVKAKDGSWTVSQKLPGTWNTLLAAGYMGAAGTTAYVAGHGTDDAVYAVTWTPGQATWQPPSLRAAAS